jgi:hypothetical protein
VDDPQSGFTPELSFGSHFFLDLIETNIFYTALFMDNESVVFDRDYLKRLDSCLLKILPEAGEYSEVIKVYDFEKELKLLSDVTSQKVICLKP